MIRDGKRSLCRELVRFLHYIDDCAVKRRIILCKSAKDVSFTGKCKDSGAKRHVGEDRTTEKLKKQMGTIYVTSNGDEENIAELEEFHFMTDDAQEIPIVSKSKVGALVKGNKGKTPATKTVKFGKNRIVYELASSAEDDSFDDGEEIMMISRDDGVGSNSRTRSRSGVVIKGNGGKTRVMKTVRFDENGNVYKVYGDTPEASVSGGDESSTSGSNNENRDGYNEVEDTKYVPKENEVFKEEEEEEVHSETEEESSSEGSKEEAQVSEKIGHMGRNEHKQEFQLRKGSSMFSPPLPLKMEP